MDISDFTNLEEFKSKVMPETKMVGIETPINPTLTVIVIKAFCDIAKRIAKVCI